MKTRSRGILLTLPELLFFRMFESQAKMKSRCMLLALFPGICFCALFSDRILGICIVISAMIDASSNKVYSTTLNLPSMESTQIIKSLKTAFPGYPVDLLNDTACYSYAEKVCRGHQREKFCFLSTSVAASVLLFFIEGEYARNCQRFFYPVRPLFH